MIIMSNTSKGRAVKESKFWMKMVPNTGLKRDFDRIFGEELEWGSPLKGKMTNIKNLNYRIQS